MSKRIKSFLNQGGLHVQKVKFDEFLGLRSLKAVEAEPRGTRRLHLGIAFDRKRSVLESLELTSKCQV